MTTLGTPEGKPWPCVLVAHHLPAMRGLGSSVYLVAHCGFGADSYPYFPIGGVTVMEGAQFGSALQILAVHDENYYNFEYRGEPIEFEDWDVDIYDVDSLLDAVLLLAADELQIQPWDEEFAKVQTTEAWDCPDEFLELAVQQFPEPEG